MSDPTPVPPKPDGWDLFGQRIASVGRWTTGVAEVRVGGAVATTFGAAWRAVAWILGRLHWCIVLFASVLIIGQFGPQLPLPNWPIWHWPTPTPVVPSALESSVRTAYLAETDPAKATHAKALADVYAKFVPMARAAGTVKTAGDLDAAFIVAVKAANLGGTLPVVGKAVGDYLNAILPTTKSAPMTDQIWLQTGAEFSRVSAALVNEAK